MTGGYHDTVRHDVMPLVPQGATLLDVGGGTGATARHAKAIGRAERVGVIDGVVEPYRAELDFALEADLEDRDAVERFLEAEGPFDTILLLDVLEHLVDPWESVDLFARHLAQGGAMVASVPNVRHWSVSGALLFGGHWNYAASGLLDRTHLRFFVRRTAIELLDRPGLRIATVAPSPMGSRIHRLVNALTLGLLRPLFTLQYFIVARREGE